MRAAVAEGVNFFDNCWDHHNGVLMKSKVVIAVERLRYALSLPTSVAIDRAAPHAVAGEVELFKTSAHFDSTGANPKWFGGDSPCILTDRQERLTGNN